MFNIARIPELFADILSTRPPDSSPTTRKLLVAIHNFFYTITVYDPPSNSDKFPTLKSVSEIDAQIRAVVLDVEQRLASGEQAVPIGILSADDRDKWALVCYICVHSDEMFRY